MLLPKKNRVMIYSQLFKDGVCVCKKDTKLKKHFEIEVPNLHVMKMMQSLKSRGYVRETFSWQYYYYYLTDEGIEYLRGYLNLPESIKPSTLTPQARPSGRPMGMGRGSERPRRDYGGEKRMGPGGDFRPSFREGGTRGFGRGGSQLGGGGFGRGAGGVGGPRP